jgi:hypothetical protein
MHSGIGSWPGINMPVKPANSSLKLYGSAAFVRLMDELRCAAYSKECPQVSREQVLFIMEPCTQFFGRITYILMSLLTRLRTHYLVVLEAVG